MARRPHQRGHARHGLDPRGILGSLHLLSRGWCVSNGAAPGPGPACGHRREHRSSHVYLLRQDRDNHRRPPKPRTPAARQTARRGSVTLARVSGVPSRQRRPDGRGDPQIGGGEGDRGYSPRDARDFSFHRGPKARDRDRTSGRWAISRRHQRGRGGRPRDVHPERGRGGFLARRDREARQRGAQGDHGRVAARSMSRRNRAENRMRASSSQAC